MDDANSIQKDRLDKIRDYDAKYKKGHGKVFRQIFRDAYGDDFPEELEPHSFVTKTNLARMLHFLDVEPGDVLCDLGCGRGGPGLWLARETGADLIGIDLSSNAIKWATQRITAFDLGGRARFLQDDLCETSLPDQSCDGAFSIDVLMFIQDKDAIMKEVARILRPGAPFVFIAFEDKDYEIYRSPLQDNGFRVEEYEETPDWRRRQLALYEGILAERDALIEEMGDGFHGIIKEAERGLASGLENRRRALVVARRI